MKRLKKILLIFVTYLVAFIMSAGISSIVLNQGKVSGVIQDTDATLPLLYVRAGGRLINEMHGYKEPVDAGYYRDTLTPVGDSQTINLCIGEYEPMIVSASYELYNDQYRTLIESGECTDIEKSDTMLQTQIVFHEKLSSNREYCLRIRLTDADDEVVDYYTRVRYGSDLKVAEKLKFVLDFNEATFDKDNASQLSSYLETSSAAGSSDYSLVTLYSSSDMVTWGSLAPYRTSDLAVRLKEINTETAAFTLSYMIESSAGEVTTFYDVEEYYRIRIGEDKIYLLYFEREMTEDISMADITVNEGGIRIGVGDISELSFGNYGTEEHAYGYVASDNQLWLFDMANRIFTKVYASSDDGHNCGRQDETGIKVIHADSSTGDLYFAVYGYMHDGNYEGREGVMIYHFRHEDVLLEELIFIPFGKGFEQLRSGIEELAYMNDSGQVYMMLEDSVYKIDVTLGRMETAWTGLGSGNCVASDEGILVMAESDSSRLKVIDLNTDKERYIEGGEYLIVPLGFAGEDLIYGLVEPKLAVEDSTGVVQMPMSEVRIVDSDLKEIKSYQKNGSYVMRINITSGNILLKIGKAVQNGGYTDYEDAGEDYIVRNREEDTGLMRLVSQKDSIRGLQNWLQLDTANSFVPITQTARYLDPGYDITKEYIPSDSVELCYYVYTKGHLDAVFETIQEAIVYGNSTNAGATVMSSHKQVAWQRAGRAYIWELKLSAIGKADNSDALNRVILEAITGFEGWDMPGQIDSGLPLFAAMTDYLPTETVDLSGLDLTDVLHFVYRDRVVAVKTGSQDFALIVGYNNNYIQLADPAEGEIYSLSWDAAEELFESAGKVYYSYYD